MSGKSAIRKVTPAEARETGRCACPGCDACVAGNGSACGVALGFDAEFCKWCRWRRTGEPVHAGKVSHSEDAAEKYGGQS